MNYPYGVVRDLIASASVDAPEGYLVRSVSAGEVAGSGEVAFDEEKDPDYKVTITLTPISRIRQEIDQKQDELDRLKAAVFNHKPKEQ